MKRSVLRPARTGLIVVLALAAAAVGACGTAAGGLATGNGKLGVAAAENFWGSIAAQLGGDRVSVTSIIANPNTDPHSYEPTAADARTIAAAQMVIVNGVGYDPWAPRLVAANPLSGRVVLDVGHLVHVAAGGNPHRWYSPADVMSVVDQIAADYARLDPKDASFFAAQKTQFVDQGLARYRQLVATIKSTYAGTAVGASESIFAPLAQALGLDLITPPSFLAAISEGTGPTAADKATIDRQIAARQIKIYVYNSQNATPDVQRQVDAARARGIPVTTITETLTPARASFQDWQVTQLQALEAALAKATGR